MATSYQRRPDGKAPDPKALVKPDAQLEAQLHKLDEQKRALEQRGEKTDGIDAELAARLAPAMGNAALAGLLNRGTETASSAGDTALEEKQSEEDKEEEGEEKEAGEIEHVLPSFSTGGGGGGGGGQPPWAMARQFGGDDDDVVEVIAASGARWRPMPVLPDPDDEDAELEPADDDAAPEDADGPDLRGATAALGEASWRPTTLSRGLRNPRLLARREFGPEALVDADGLDHAFGRARAMLRFVARHGDGLDAVLIARASAAGEPMFPAAAGFAGATARALALVEVALVSLPPAWERLLDVVADPRPRGRVENVAAEVAENGGLSCTALFEAVLGARVLPVEVDPVLAAHPGAVAALVAAARVDPLPLVDLWTLPERPPADPALAALDAVMARFTGGEDPTDQGLGGAELGPLFDTMNQLLGAIGGALVEVTAAGVAVAPHVPVPSVVGVLAPTETALRRAARRLYAAGQSLETLVGTEAFEEVRSISAEALAVRQTVEVVRQSALATLAGLLVESEHAPPDVPELIARAEADALAGRSASARGLLDAAIVSAPPEQEGRVLLASGALRARMGLDDAGQLAEAGERLGGGVLAAGARSLAAGLALSRGGFGAAEVHGAEGGRIGRDHGLPYVVADAACTEATALFGRGADWRAPLRDAADWMHERDEGGPLNLLKARWAELRAGEVNPRR